MGIPALQTISVIDSTTYQKKHNLPHSRLHELRHSCASMLISWLGHADIKMTANICSHLDTARKTNTAASLEEKFGASGRPVADRN